MERATSRQQRGLDTVTSWSTSLKMKLSAPKSEYSFFTISKMARWCTALYLSRQQIKYNSIPMFLGITYDRQLTFGVHASIFGSKMKQQAGALWCLASTERSYDKSIQRFTYTATDRSTVEYAAAAWLPWVSISTMERLKIGQIYAGRAMTGQITPVDAILAEADLPTVAT